MIGTAGAVVLSATANIVKRSGDDHAHDFQRAGGGTRHNRASLDRPTSCRAEALVDGLPHLAPRASCRDSRRRLTRSLPKLLRLDGRALVIGIRPGRRNPSPLGMRLLRRNLQHLNPDH